ncbi:MCE family protein [Streptomyces sp. LP05-1]|uniref:MCE family protein n=1 Tax=Streptomyces pyxinae TaxID=2970734 RepID=A0ABT2CKM5_9ACTN|nr:MCE family protein [Streptomyces sp. LP05-1]MCS0637968.1 MCE family protein [Streptomyces sp. LP05-1]
MNARRALALAAGLAVVAVAGGSGVMALDESGTTRITARFDRAVGVYEGSDLRVLGVKVGTVGPVRPAGKEVEVTLLLDADVPVPAGAHAVVVAPSVVSDRYIQLAPAYTGGPRIRPGAVLPAARNATPMEIDQLYASLTELSEALGPDGANARGALARLLDTGAANLKGNGKAIGDSIEEFGKAAKTLNRGSDDLFATIASLQSFTTMLKNNDGGVRRAERQLASVTGFLAADRENLAAALRELGTALAQVKTFIAENRGALKQNVDILKPLTETLVAQRASLAEALDTAPLAAGNALKAYDPAHRTLNGRADINELSPKEGASGPAGLVPVGPERRRALPALPLPAVGTVYGSPEKGASR